MVVSKIFKVRTANSYNNFVLDIRENTINEFGAHVRGYGSYTSGSFDLLGGMIPLVWPADCSISKIYKFKGSGTERSQMPITQKTMYIE